MCVTFYHFIIALLTMSAIINIIYMSNEFYNRNLIILKIHVRNIFSSI
jgi:hypothetical protein